MEKHFEYYGRGYFIREENSEKGKFKIFMNFPWHGWERVLRVAVGYFNDEQMFNSPERYKKELYTICRKKSVVYK